MDTIFMNSKNSGIFDLHRLLLNLTDKINLKRSDKYVPLSNLSIYYTWKNIKSHTKIVNLKYQFRHGMKNLNSVSHIQDYFEYILKNHGEKTDNPLVRIYVKKIENRITFTIKTGYYLELLTPGMMK